MNSSEPQPNLPPLFLDRSLGRNVVAGALRSTGATVHIHDDHFGAADRDEVWIEAAGENGWIALTKDAHIKYRESERVAVQRAGVALFVLTSGDLRGGDMATAFVRALPHIRRFLLLHKPPFIARIHKDGRVVLDSDLS